MQQHYWQYVTKTNWDIKREEAVGVDAIYLANISLFGLSFKTGDFLCVYITLHLEFVACYSCEHLQSCGNQALVGSVHIFAIVWVSNYGCEKPLYMQVSNRTVYANWGEAPVRIWFRSLL